MKRTAIVGLVAGTLLTLSTMTALAADEAGTTTTTPAEQSVSQAAPAPEQATSLTDVQVKMLEAEKDMVNAQLGAGLITQQQADALLQRLDAQESRLKPLTTEQIKALQDAWTKIIQSRKDLVNALLAVGKINQKQADALQKQLDALAAEQWQPGQNAMGTLKEALQSFALQNQAGLAIEKNGFRIFVQGNAPALKNGAPVQKNGARVFLRRVGGGISGVPNPKSAPGMMNQMPNTNMPNTKGAVPGMMYRVPAMMNLW